MFSIITIASSTTKPVAMVRAISDRLSSEKPHRYITASVPTSDSGTDRLGISVALKFDRNRKITSTTSATDTASSNCTSRTDALMVTVRSVRIRMSTAPGRVFCRVGSSCLIESTTLITLAPGWRWMLITMAGVRSTQAPSFEFSAPWITWATSLSSTGRPFL